MQIIITRKAFTLQPEPSLCPDDPWLHQLPPTGTVTASVMINIFKMKISTRGRESVLNTEHQESPLSALLVKLSLSHPLPLLPCIGQSNHPSSYNINFLLTLHWVCYYHLIDCRNDHLWIDKISDLLPPSDRQVGPVQSEVMNHICKDTVNQFMLRERTLPDYTPSIFFQAIQLTEWDIFPSVFRILNIW